MIVVLAFFGLLLLGLPIAFVIISAAVVGVRAFTDTSMIIVIQQMFGGLDNFVQLAIPFFVIAGNMAANGKTSEHLIKVMSVVFGRLKGGSVIATIAACAFFAAISGSGLATIVAIGTLMIPGLIREGYPDKMAVGTVCCAGSLGILIPPSAPMILICVAMGTSVGRQFTAGFIPGIFLAICWSIYVFIVSRKRNYGGEISYSAPEAAQIFLKAVPALLFPIIVLGSIYTGWATPTEAAAISVVYVLFLELFIYRTARLTEIPNMFYQGLISASTLVLIISAAQVLNWLMTVQQVPVMISTMLATAVSSKTAFILLMWLVFLVCGCFVDLVALIVVLAPILVPSLAIYGIDPIHFGIMAVMATQIGCITPPFGVNLFVTMNVAGKNFTEVVGSTFPYLIILVIVSMVVSFIPEIAMFLPNRM
ncbi:MAG: TRAP transporter large permease [Candidatus Adiutrix sp.]|jgi:C4-dicarboxylate transporter DctM subunit|nr:TRAP transporter large permease [Candidatus Adiutrix sp.]